MNTEKLHAYLRFFGLYDNIHQNKKNTTNHKLIHEISLKQDVDRQGFKNK